MELPPTKFLVVQFLSLFVNFSLYLQQTSSTPHNNLTDLRSLMAFKASVDDPCGFLASSWTLNTSICNWNGVSCSRRHQRVVSLNLNSFCLQGTISPQLANLSFLSFLDMANNTLTGLIPDTISRLSRLKVLVLERNRLYGPIPPTIFNMSSLIHVYINQNNLSGSLPSNDSIFSLPRVQNFTLSENQLTGVIPSSFALCSDLRMLALDYNEFIGRIPDTLSQLPRLRVLLLHSNQLHGPIPPAIFNMSSLMLLYAGTNKLSGALPSNESIHFLPQLRHISLPSNQLTGTIPSSFGLCPELQILSLSTNKFRGEIPVELGNLPRLTNLVLSQNILSGTIPNSLGNLTRLTELSLEANKLEGEIPNTFGNLVNLQQLVLGPNALTGSIPETLLNASSLQILELSSTNITGSVPDTLGKSMPLLTNLDLQSMQLTGGLGFLSYLSSCNNLQNLNIAANKFDVVLPNCIGNLSSSLQYFDVSANLIHGEIPTGMGNLTSLLLLNLENNFLRGKIPSTLGRLYRLQELSLNNNKLTGSIPIEIGQLINLGVLELNKNSLTGFIPSCLGNISGLQYLYLNSNKLSSGIPESLWTLSGLLQLFLDHNTLEGSVSEQVGNLKSLYTLLLSENRLSGNISNALGELQMLTYLDLSNNFFHGDLPQSIGELLSIEYLNLSHNSLTGSIPWSLGNLRYLSSLDLSFNKLTGQIPKGRVFSNLSIPSLEGNTGLCGATQLGFPLCSKHDSTSKTRKCLSLLKYILSVIACVTVILPVCFYLRLIVLERRKATNPIQNNLGHLENYQLISYHELLHATNNFSEANLLGRGGFGSVFKGCLDDGLLVAVKVLNLEVEGASKSFDAECHALSVTRHRNLVKIISVCSNMDIKALILQYMPNGSLEKWLHCHNYYLNILQRLNVMLDVSSALEYLHHQHPQIIVHCDLKPSNVLLDEYMTGHLSDFGIAKLFLNNSKSMAAIGAPGTIGYMAPEYGSTGRISRKGDIYSFGILLFETFTRKKPTDIMFNAEINLRQWVHEAYPSAVLEIVDHNLLRDNLTDERESETDSATHQCLLSIIDLGLLCSKDSPEERMSMEEVVPRLQKIKMEYLTKLPSS